MTERPLQTWSLVTLLAPYSQCSHHHPCQFHCITAAIQRRLTYVPILLHTPVHYHHTMQHTEWDPHLSTSVEPIPRHTRRKCWKETLEKRRKSSALLSYRSPQVVTSRAFSILSVTLPMPGTWRSDSWESAPTTRHTASVSRV